MQDFTKLNIWKRSLELSLDIYEITRSYPNSETYGLTSQMRRCSTSVPANISEGAGRESARDFKNFLNIAGGSLNELYTFIEISYRLELIDMPKRDIILKEIDELKRMIFTFTKTLKVT